MVRKLPPAQLGEELPVAPHRRGNGPRLGKAPHRLPHLARADLAKVQVRRQARRAHEVRPVAALGVGQEPVAQEALQLGLGPDAARLPGRAQAIGPAAPWLQLQRGQRQRRGPPGRWGEFARRGQRLARFGGGQAGSPERCEDPEWLAGFVADSPRLVEQRAAAALRLQSPRTQGFLDLSVARDDGGLIAPVPEDRFGPRGLGHAQQLGQGRARAG